MRLTNVGSLHFKRSQFSATGLHCVEELIERPVTRHRPTQASLALTCSVVGRPRRVELHDLRRLRQGKERRDPAGCP